MVENNLVANNLLPDLSLRFDWGFLLRHEDSLEQSRLLWRIFLSLPCNVLSYPLLIQTYGGGEIPDAPDAVFFEVYLTDEVATILRTLHLRFPRHLSEHTLRQECNTRIDHGSPLCMSQRLEGD